MEKGIAELSLADYTHGGPAIRDAFSQALLQGLQRYGFIILRDHPISPAMLDRAYELSVAFFSQSAEIKRRYIGGARGYVPFRTERAKDRSAADLKEFWQIGPERNDGVDRGATEPPNIWPATPQGFKETFLALYAQLQKTGAIILEALTPGLELPRDYFASLIADSNSVLRLLHYPPIPADIEPGSLRSAPHEDINLLTLLVAAQGAGLELLERNGHWLAVNADRNHIIVDSGDMLARLTNDVIPATTHRVVNPDGENVSRYSMPFFMHPNNDAMLSCLPSCIGSGAKYADITAGAFLEQRLRAIGLIA